MIRIRPKPLQAHAVDAVIDRDVIEEGDRFPPRFVVFEIVERKQSAFLP